MKNAIYIMLFSLMLTFSGSAFAQTPAPPTPNGGSNPSNPGSGNTPVGGGAPIAGGVGILLALGASYGTKKYYDFKKGS